MARSKRASTCASTCSNGRTREPTPPGGGERGLWRRITAGRTGRFTPWKFNWLANHKIIAALERVRVHARGDLLDVGCGSKPFAPLFAGRGRRYWGSDLAASRYLGDARSEAHPSD